MSLEQLQDLLQHWEYMASRDAANILRAHDTYRALQELYRLKTQTLNIQPEMWVED